MVADYIRECKLTSETPLVQCHFTNGSGKIPGLNLVVQDEITCL